MAKRIKKKPQALKFNAVTEMSLRILQEIDGVTYNGYVESVLEKHIEKASKIMMDKSGVDLYSMAKKKCESDESYKDYI
jgi:hypothetical protein